MVSQHNIDFKKLVLQCLFVFNGTLREKCPNMKFFLVSIFSHLDWIRKIRTRKNSVFGHFSRSDPLKNHSYFYIYTFIYMYIYMHTYNVSKYIYIHIYAIIYVYIKHTYIRYIYIKILNTYTRFKSKIKNDQLSQVFCTWDLY